MTEPLEYHSALMDTGLTFKGCRILLETDDPSMKDRFIRFADRKICYKQNCPDRIDRWYLLWENDNPPPLSS